MPPITLQGWKNAFDNLIENARCAPMTDDDRELLIEYVSQQAENMFFGPSPNNEKAVPDNLLRDDPWRDIGYN